MIKKYLPNLLMIKNDPEFENICINSKHSHDILEIADGVILQGRKLGRKLILCGHFSPMTLQVEKKYLQIDVSQDS